ncbi:single-stranded-DNA-specific exonuclease RecJ [Candidatus Uhrbacteria bacterium]|nr:single-stranded-DNA-specific exonuclease RecJ [Candidatus Uhrbacteria bacterium]
MRWNIPEPLPFETLARFEEMHPVLVQLLWNRGLQTREDMRAFLNPDWTAQTHPPSLFARMGDAVAFVFETLERREVITVHGDYDADGVCGSAVLLTTLRDLCRAGGFDETKITSYIPHREKEGYGFSPETVDILRGQFQTKLVITVDCGISNKPAIDKALSMGIRTIVCDHHTMPDELPTDAMLIHPLVPGEAYPNKNLCGTGVAFKLASALLDEGRRRGLPIKEGAEKWLLDLVAIATVTDVMKLQEENRVLEHFGLLVLNKTRRPGLLKMFEIAGIKPGEIDTQTIGFQIGPRLNAAGRMHHAKEALDLLLSEDDLQAARCAAQLDATNKERQVVSDGMYEQAKEIIGNDPQDQVIVVHHETWSPAIVGLVAGKLVRDFSRPVYAIGFAEGRWVGSGRSVKGFHVTEALHSTKELLGRFGGHPEACGFTLTSGDALAPFREAILSYAKDSLTPEMLEPTIDIDAEIRLEDVSWDLQAQIERLKPTGQANPPPKFASKGISIMAMTMVGKEGKHLKLSVQSSDGKVLPMICFNMGHLTTTLSLGDRIDAVYDIGVNEWNGFRQLQLKGEDIKKV